MAILQLLRENSRTQPAQIAGMLGLPEAQVTATIADMEQQQIIRRYTVVVDPERAGDDTVTALIEVKVHPQREVGFDRVAARIARFPEVNTCYLLSGTYDLAVMVEAPDLKSVARFVAEKLATLEFVVSTTTHFVLRRYKADGCVLVDDGEDRRLAVAP